MMYIFFYLFDLSVSIHSLTLNFQLCSWLHRAGHVRSCFLCKRQPGTVGPNVLLKIISKQTHSCIPKGNSLSLRPMRKRTHTFTVNCLKKNCFDICVETKNCTYAWLSRLGLQNTPTASLQRDKTSPMSVLDMTLNNLMVWHQ